MSNVFDQTLDLNGQELHRLASVYPLPEFVKNASQRDVCGEDLAPHQFADMTQRLFPCHTKAATVVSAIFFHEKKAEFNKHRAAAVEKRLLNFADYHGVTDYVNGFSEKVAEAKNYTAYDLPDSEFAIVFDATDGTKERHYPVRNVGEVKAAADWLAKNRDDLPLADKRKIADKLLEKGAEFGANLVEHYDMLVKMAGLGSCSGKDAAAMIRTRIRSLGHTHRPNELQQELEKLAEICEKDPNAVHHFHAMTKIAELVDAFDREHGIHRRYDDILQRPEDVLFSVTQKAAAEFEDELVGSALTGHYYKKADLERLPVRDLADALGEDFTDEVAPTGAWVDMKKLASIVPTLPKGDMEMFDEVAQAAGITPFAVKSASVGQSISASDQASLASRHEGTPGSLWDRVR